MRSTEKNKGLITAFIALAVSLLAGLMLCACDGVQPEPQPKPQPSIYTITYIAGENGRIVGNAKQTVVGGESGTEVTAIANYGYAFVKWSDGVTTASRTDKNVSGDIEVTATFEKTETPPPVVYCNVSYSAGAGGSISGETAQRVESGKNAQTVTAVPDEGYRFVKWSDGVMTAERTETNVMRDIAVTAEFEKLTFNIVYTAMAGGRVEGNVEQVVECGCNSAIVTAVPDFGYEFVAWSDGATTSARRETNVKADVAVSAIFKKIDEITVAYTAKDGGYIKGDALQTVAWGGNCSTVVAEPVNEGYIFVCWSDGVETPERRDAEVTADGSLLVLEAIFEIYNEPNGDDCLFTLTDDQAGYKVRVRNRRAEKFDIPAYYNGLPVVEIQDNAFVSCANLTTVNIPNTVTRIGNNAFLCCKLLTEIRATDSIRIIGSKAFALCESLRSFTGMSAVEELGEKAFALCPKLDNITLPASLTYVGDKIFRGYVNTVYVELTEAEMNALNENWKAGIGENAIIIYKTEDDIQSD